jgi:S-phase kinase-associated protein 1
MQLKEVKVILKSSDEEQFPVDVEIAKCSVLIRDMLENLGVDEGKEEVIPIQTVKGSILKMIVDWATHHKDDPPPPPHADVEGEPRSTDMSSWDQQFLQVNQTTLFELIMAANYLDIKPLLDLGCKKVALLIAGRTTQEIRDLFNIENDFTPEEEEQIRRENEWVEERKTGVDDSD